MFNQPEARRRILVVEDDPDLREQVAELLEDSGFDVEIALDGEDALVVLRAQPSFDLILLDLMLPGTDGWQFRVAQRTDPILRSIPVIAMSASNSAHATAIDADAYVPKPFDPDALVHSIKSVLEQRRSAQTDRLASLGRLAAGIAHEVNNPLTYVYASLSMAEHLLADPKPNGDPMTTSSRIVDAVGSIRCALEGVNRIRTIMSGVRLLIDAPDERRGPTDVRDVIGSALAIIEQDVRAKARLETELQEVPIVSANAGQLTHVIVSLVNNALESMSSDDASKQRIVVRTSTSPANEAVIEVIDSGQGMTEDVRKKSFEPFFTTKLTGTATGLGLSICHGIVRNHGGNVEVESEPDRGSCFRVRLPPMHPTATSIPPKSTGRPRLLIVEDDRHVAEALARLLGQQCETTTAADVEDALRRIAASAPKPDIILCDFFLGTATAKELYDELRAHYRELTERIIFMTGSRFTATSRNFLDEVANPCLEKPFTVAEFSRAIRHLPSRSSGRSQTHLRAASSASGRSQKHGR